MREGNVIAFGFWKIIADGARRDLLRGPRDVVILYAKGEWRSAMSLPHDPKNVAEIAYWNSPGGRR
jgi:hypothetical protein